MVATLQAWTFESYWSTVMGARTADEIVAEYLLVEDGLNEWLGLTEVETAQQSHEFVADADALLDAWLPFRARALDELRGAVERAEDEVSDEIEWS